jgi:hypothetical protein
MISSALALMAVTSDADSSVVYPLKVSVNGRYLVDQHNVPYLMAGDSPQSLVANLSEADAGIYIADRAARGFNSLWIDVLCNPYVGARPDGRALDGTLPFTNMIPGTASYDLTTPNEAYFAHVDRVINLAAQHGLQVLLGPIETGGWLQTMRDNGTDKCRAYGQYLGNRYKNFPNILWISGNDFQTWETPSNDAVAVAVARGILDNDTNHLHTIELDYLVSSSLDDTNWASIAGLNAAYTYFPTYAEVLHAYGHSATTPVFLVEANYESETNPATDGGSTRNLRLQEYWSLLSGASGQLYGNHYTWSFFPGWQINLDTVGVKQFGYVKALFDSRPWYNLVPDTSHVVVTHGYGTFSSSGSIDANDYGTAASTPDGMLVMMYMPTVRTVTVDMSKLSGEAMAWWYDPASGSFIQISGSSFTNSGTQNFTPPGNNADGDGDWVLLVETDPVEIPGQPIIPIFLQQNYAALQTLASQVSVAYTGLQSGGDANVLAIGWFDTVANISAVTDSSGNVYQAAFPTQRGNGISQAIYYAKNIKGGTNTVTVRFDRPAGFADVRAGEYSGLDPQDPFDSAAVAGGNGTSADSGPVITTTTYELLFGAGISKSPFTGGGNGYGQRVITSPAGNIIEDKVSGGPGAYTATATLAGSNDWLMQVAAFRSKISALASPRLRIFLTQAGLTLQESSTLAPANWIDSTRPVQVVGGESQTIISPLAGQQFFRLKSVMDTAPPRLRISLTASNTAVVAWPIRNLNAAVVAWPVTKGFSLQHITDLAKTSWGLVADPIQTVGNEYQLLVWPLHGQQFYRLTSGVTVPQLRISFVSQDRAVLAWPANGAVFTLQQTATLTPPNWVDATNRIQAAAGENQAVISPLAGSQFYRLKYP